MDSELIKEARAIEDTVVIDGFEPPPRRLVIDIRALTVVKVLAVLLGAWLLTQIWPLITLLALSVMLAAALAPYLALLERTGMGRAWSLTLVALSIMAAFAFIIWLLVPGLIDQTRSLLANSDGYARDLQSLLARHGIHANLVKLWHSVPKRLQSMNGIFVDAAMALFDSVVAMATVLVVTVYLLSDQERIKGFFVGLFPQKRRPEMLALLAELRRQVGGYVRGQLITSGLAGVFSFVVLLAAQVPNQLTLAIYVAIADLVPMFGQMLGMIPAVLIALTISPIKGIIVLAGFVLYQQIENHYIAPRVYASTMRVSSLVALVALLIGAKLLGMLGMLVSLPIVAGLPVVLDFVGIHLNVGERPAAEPDAAADVT